MLAAKVRKASIQHHGKRVRSPVICYLLSVKQSHYLCLHYFASFDLHITRKILMAMQELDVLAAS